MQDLPLELDLSNLKKCLPEALQAQSVTAVILALGSNHQAEYYLARVRENLATLGKIQLSTAFQNPDFTATVSQPKPDYSNQGVYLMLTSPMSLRQLQKNFKQFESNCDRCRQTAPTATRQVTMDIDILLIKLSDAAEWIVMADRYPFKEHESAGVIELVERGLF